MSRASEALTFKLRVRPRYWRNRKPRQFELQFVPWETAHEERLTHYKSGIGSRQYAERAICSHSRKNWKTWKRTHMIDRVTCPKCIMYLAQQAAWVTRKNRREQREKRAADAAQRVKEAADRLAGTHPE